MPSLSYLWAARGRRGNNKLGKVLAAHGLTGLRNVWSEVMKHSTEVKWSSWGLNRQIEVRLIKQDQFLRWIAFSCGRRWDVAPLRTSAPSFSQPSHQRSLRDAPWAYQRSAGSRRGSSNRGAINGGSCGRKWTLWSSLGGTWSLRQSNSNILAAARL